MNHIIESLRLARERAKRLGVLLAALANIFLSLPALSLALSAAIIFIMGGFILYDMWAPLSHEELAARQGASAPETPAAVEKLKTLDGAEDRRAPP